MPSSFRLRFAPSPTGKLHLGSVRTALFNYIFAKKFNGTFILRIEDSDPKRNVDPGAKNIIDDLTWLQLAYDEGPGIDGPFKPYFQSERHAVYQEVLDKLINQKKVYRCFCSPEKLEKSRARQIALKKPPRYDQTCLKLSAQATADNIEKKAPFIWRFFVNPTEKIAIEDIVRGKIDFDMQHFSDFPLTREDGSFTFLFANAVDDITMHITHIFRGEDHISNTPCQALIYKALHKNIPLFWHMPVICNTDGKKLSKRDFGFSLKDLKQAGYLPEAICNYLGILGASYEHEIMPVEQLIQKVSFEQQSSSPIKYDLDKLTWINQSWIKRLTLDELIEQAKPFLYAVYPEAKALAIEQLRQLFSVIQHELKILSETPTLLNWYFKEPQLQKNQALQIADLTMINKILDTTENIITHEKQLSLETLKAAQKEFAIPAKQYWHTLRFALTGNVQGAAIKDLISTLDQHTILKRIHVARSIIN